MHFTTSSDHYFQGKNSNIIVQTMMVMLLVFAGMKAT